MMEPVTLHNVKNLWTIRLLSGLFDVYTCVVMAISSKNVQTMLFSIQPDFYARKHSKIQCSNIHSW